MSSAFDQQPYEMPARPAPRSKLFDLGQLDVEWDERRRTLWTFMTPQERPNYNERMLRDFEAWQSGIVEHFGGGERGMRYLVLGSRFPGVFNYGGDLHLFANLIRSNDREALIRYGKACVRILHRNDVALGLPIVTIALVQGDALGGGFESLLSFDMVIAERGASFGLPETMFGLFPGMGAHSFLTRKLGAAAAGRLIQSGKTYSAEEMYDLGIVHLLVEPGEGEEATRAYIDKNQRRQAGQFGAFRAARRAAPVPLDELEEIVTIWADTALKLGPNDLKLMQRLVAAQSRRMQAAMVG